MEINRTQCLQELLDDEIILYKFLSTVKGKSKVHPPAYLTNDIKAGIKYVFSMLTDQEYFVLHLLYIDNLSEAKICDLLNVSSTHLAKIKSESKRKVLAKWGYIQYGIEGWLKKREKDIYNKGYLHGHKAGYIQGKEDIENDSPPFFLSNEQLSLPIESLSLSKHAWLCLMRYNYKRIGDIAPLNDSQILRMRGLGKATASEIAHALNRIGVKHTEWDQFLL